MRSLTACAGEDLAGAGSRDGGRGGLLPWALLVAVIAASRAANELRRQSFHRTWETDVELGLTVSGNEFTQTVSGTVTETG